MREREREICRLMYFIISRFSRRRRHRRSRCRLVTILLPLPRYNILLRGCSSGDHKFLVLRRESVLPLWLFYGLARQCIDDDRETMPPVRRRTFDNYDG